MLIHRKCGFPLEPDESHVHPPNTVMGLFCTLCRDEGGAPTEILDEDDIGTIDILKGLYGNKPIPTC